MSTKTKTQYKVFRVTKRWLKVWTWGYFPFTIGGRCNREIATMVQARGPYDLGLGYKGYIAKSPNGRTYIAEATTGAFIGSTLVEVRDDIATGDREIMKRQVADSAKSVANAQVLKSDDFWKLLSETTQAKAEE